MTSCLKQERILIGTRAGSLVVPNVTTGKPVSFQPFCISSIHSRRAFAKAGSITDLLIEVINRGWGDDSTFPRFIGLRRLNKSINVTQDEDTRRTILGFLKFCTENSFCFDVTFTDDIVAVDLEMISQPSTTDIEHHHLPQVNASLTFEQPSRRW
jgi:hypothetical protein